MSTASVRHTKAFLVEDSAPIRDRLARMIAALDGVSIVGDADTSASAILKIARSEPHVVVLDIHLREGSGLDVLRKLRPVFRGMAFIVLTNYPSDQHRRICMEAGADYFLDKNGEFEKVKDIIAALGSAAQAPEYGYSRDSHANPM
jgi:two-component system response regulator DevR